MDSTTLAAVVGVLFMLIMLFVVFIAMRSRSAPPLSPDPLKEAPPGLGHADDDGQAPETLTPPNVPEPRRSLAEGLSQTRSGFIGRLGRLFERDSLDEELLEELEEVLYTADIGPQMAQKLLAEIEERLSGDAKQRPEQVWAFLKERTRTLLAAHEAPPLAIPQGGGNEPFVILVVGVNGAGKTTTIGKLASQFKREGHAVLLVAGDTFRAAAVEQLQRWGERAGCPVHVGKTDADPASVVYGGIKRAQEEEKSIVICDTAGRLHTHTNLMKELEKITRVIGRAQPGAPHETLLVLDAHVGQNALQQANLFGKATQIRGIVLTKLDGTAKGGVLLGLCDTIGIPIRYIGIGEGIEDLRPFEADRFVEALFAES
ncbi:MAG: signal recognition particle-docking protein FtsY [Myxococcota bacterium]